MSKTLDEIRKKLQALDTKPSGSRGGDKTIYPHWNIPEGTQAVLRLAPDADPDNTFFWAERQLIKLPFAGIKGQDEHKAVTVQVPCMEMWDGLNSCPILNEVRPMWKDKSLEETARKYWKKRTYFFQGFVETDPMNEQEKPENPIRKFIIGPQIFAIIKAALMDPDMGPHSPVDYINGINFIVAKTSKGGFADYSTSKWARKDSSLTPEHMAAIEQYGLVKLSEYLPKKPTPEQLAIIFELFQSSIDGELYDPERFSKHYKPFGFDAADSADDADGGEGKRAKPVYAPRTTGVPVTPPKTVIQAKVADDDTPPFDPDPVPAKEAVVETATAGKSPQEILAMIRNRNKA
jgi:gp32 DNA binding protein like